MRIERKGATEERKTGTEDEERGRERERERERPFII